MLNTVCNLLTLELHLASETILGADVHTKPVGWGYTTTNKTDSCISQSLRNQ